MFVQNIVALPEPIKAAVITVLTFLLSFALSWLAVNVPWLADFLGQYKDQAVVLISGALFGWIEVQLNLFPQYEPIFNAGLALVVAALAVFGLPFVTFKFLQAKGVRALQ